MDRTGWTSGITAINVGKKLRIVPYWESWNTRSDRLNIISDPGPSFGGANHATTIMALEFIEEVLFSFSVESTKVSTFLDVGAGTGILAITGAAIGAEFSVGVDPDPMAIWTAKRNICLNEHNFSGVNARPEVIIGDIKCIRKGFQLVVANLIGPLLINIQYDLEHLTDDTLIISGIRDHIREQVLEAYSAEGLVIEGTKSRDGWNSAILKRIKEARQKG